MSKMNLVLDLISPGGGMGRLLSDSNEYAFIFVCFLASLHQCNLVVVGQIAVYLSHEMSTWTSSYGVYSERYNLIKFHLKSRDQAPVLL